MVREGPQSSKETLLRGTSRYGHTVLGPGAHTHVT